MEDIKAYLKSGMLELYALGDLDMPKRLQVECIASRHPQLKTELDEIGYALEQYALINAVEPAPQLRNKILLTLSGR